MASRHRPGALTALAALNFIFGAIGLVVALYALAGAVALDRLAGGGRSGAGMIYASSALDLGAVGLLLVAGVGYLRQRRFLGRTLGNAYSALALVAIVFDACVARAPLGPSTVIDLVYPLVTLALINTIFKDQLVD